MSKFQVGDKVWSVQHGWGVVDRVMADTLHPCPYPIRVKFRDDCILFAGDGRFFETHAYPTLFHDEIKPEDWPNPPRPRPVIEKGAIIEVSRSPESEGWNPMFFRAWQYENFVEAYGNSREPEKTNLWHYYRLPDGTTNYHGESDD